MDKELIAITSKTKKIEIDKEDADFLDFWRERKSWEDCVNSQGYNYMFAIERMKEAFNGNWPKKILDVGCADGCFGGIIVKNGFPAGANGSDYYGVDYSKMARKEFRKHFRNFFSNIDEVPDSSVDAAVSLQTIEHVTDPGIFVKKVMGKIKKGGIMVITTPIEKEIDSRFHVNHFNYYDIDNLCRKCNPDDFHIYYINRDGRFSPKLNCFGIVLFK